MGEILSSYQSSSNLALAERNRIVLEQLPQVRFIAQKIRSRLPQHVQLEDLVNTGVLGLIEALGKFDPRRKVELKSYASYRIRGAILDSLREQDWGSRMLRQKGRQLDEAHQKLTGELGRAPSRPELAREMSISEDKLNDLLADLQGLSVSSLQNDANPDGHPASEIHAANNEETPFELSCRAEMNLMLTLAIAKLSPRKQRILNLYYFKGLTMKEVGAILGVGESRISQMHSAAIESLRGRMNHLLQGQSPFVRKPMLPEFGPPKESSRSVSTLQDRKAQRSRLRPAALRPRLHLGPVLWSGTVGKSQHPKTAHA